MKQNCGGQREQTGREHQQEPKSVHCAAISAQLISALMITIRPAQQIAERAAMTKAAEAGESRSLIASGALRNPPLPRRFPSARSCSISIIWRGRMAGTILAEICQSASDICQRRKKRARSIARSWSGARFAPTRANCRCRGGPFCGVSVYGRRSASRVRVRRSARTRRIARSWSDRSRSLRRPGVYE